MIIIYLLAKKYENGILEKYLHDTSQRKENEPVCVIFLDLPVK